MVGFDWSPYLSGYSIEGLLNACAQGAKFVLPVMVIRAGLIATADLIRLMKTSAGG